MAAGLPGREADAAAAMVMAASEGAAASGAQAPAAAGPADEPHDALGKKRGAPEPGEAEGHGAEPVREAKRQRSGDSASHGRQPEIVGSGMVELPVDTTANLEPGGQGDTAVPEPIECAMVEPLPQQLGLQEDG